MRASILSPSCGSNHFVKPRNNELRSLNNSNDISEASSKYHQQEQYTIYVDNTLIINSLCTPNILRAYIRFSYSLFSTLQSTCILSTVSSILQTQDMTSTEEMINARPSNSPQIHIFPLEPSRLFKLGKSSGAMILNHGRSDSNPYHSGFQ